ncbi:MAG: endonuclease/exonuclease/phosphatase family protein, partial [Shimia sp.]
MRILLPLLFSVIFAAFALSYLGALHPAFDSLTVLRLPLAAALIIGALILRRGLMVYGAALWGLAVLAGYVIAPAPQIAAVDVTLYSKNLWFGNQDHPGVLADIAAADPDVITLQEVSVQNEALLAALAADYPHQHLCKLSNWSGIAVLSRLPATETAPVCGDRRSFGAMQVMHPNAPLWIISI